jgi:3-oxoacyl-[acyl-carrier protein] reductase
MTRKVFVTGGSSGIGAAIVRRLAEQGYGVMFTYYHSEQKALQLVESVNHRYTECVRACKCDLSDPDAVATLAERMANEQPQYYGFVHSAGRVCNYLAPMANLKEAKLTMEVNFWSMVTICKQLLRPMHRARSGRIVLMGSIASRVGLLGNSVYAASKAALEGFARSVVQEVGSRGITINCVAPGLIDTPMLDAARSILRGRLDEVVRESHVGTPEEIADLVAFLLSDSARGINGSTLIVDGGLSLAGLRLGREGRTNYRFRQS